jgi:hypothetical protein
VVDDAEDRESEDDLGVVDTIEDVAMLERNVEDLDCDVPEDVEDLDCDVLEDVDDRPTVVPGMQVPAFEGMDTPTVEQMFRKNCMVLARSFVAQNSRMQHEMELMKLLLSQMHFTSRGLQPVAETPVETQV